MILHGGTYSILRLLLHDKQIRISIKLFNCNVTASKILLHKVIDIRRVNE